MSIFVGVHSFTVQYSFHRSARRQISWACQASIARKSQNGPVWQVAEVTAWNQNLEPRFAALANSEAPETKFI